MTSAKSQTKLIEWIAITLGPLSWPVVFATANLVSRGPDGGWVGMAAIYTGLAVILLIHVFVPILLLVIAVRRRRSGAPIGTLAITGMCYYGLIFVVAIVLSGGFRELFQDSMSLLRALCRA